MMCGSHQARGAAALANAVRVAYGQGQSDYSLEPLVLVDECGKPIGRIQDGDAVAFCCRRGEREIQLTEAFVDPDMDRFPREFLQELTFVTLTLYHEKFKNLPAAFAPTRIEGTVGETVSQAGLRQLHVAESEKYAHVTFFFNGGNSEPYAGETDVRIPSPQGIAYDQVPELSLPQIASEVLRGIEDEFDLIVANFANGDVLGHTQNREAKLECARAVDAYLGRVVDAAVSSGYVTLVTADHGNLEDMTRPDGTHHVSHTSNEVPLVLIDPRVTQEVDLRDGNLADVAPTILSALGLVPPAAMTASSLLPTPAWGGRRSVLLLILDGWGIGRNDNTNPIFSASTPVWDNLTQRNPFARLQAAGEAVGLRRGKPGNSEAGHINMGAGRVVLQDDVRLDLAMRDGSFFRNEFLCDAINQVRRNRSCLHLIGLLSERSSHGSIEYPLALMRMAKDAGLSKVYVHIILDGRSTEPGSAPEMLEQLEAQMREIGTGQIVTGVGRGIALDRDGNYGKTQLAYDALVSGIGGQYSLA